MKHLAFVAALLCAACQNASTVTLTEAAVCSTAGNALVQLAPFRTSGKLSPGVVTGIDAAVKTMDPVCSSSTPPSPTAAAASTVVAAAGQISGILTAVKGGQ